MIGFYLITALAIGVGGAKFLNLLFPFGSLAIAVLLYFRFPLLYVGFTWWLWFISPLIRRLVDYRTGYTEPSPILLAPLFVTFLTVLTLVRYVPRLIRSYGLPFILSVASILFCLFLGFLQFSTNRVIENFLEIILPVSFGFYVVVNWQYYPAFKANIKKIFLFAMLAMGIYGIIQFITAPAWDGFWLINSDYNSGGNPNPFKLRVWSTMNSAGPFAGIMTAGLLLMLDIKSPLKVVTVVVSVLSFILSRHRSSWLSYLLGFFFVAGASPPRKQLRMLISIGLVILLIVVFSNIDPFAEIIGSRFESFTSLEDDGSALARKAEWDEFFLPALSSIVGKGLGGLGHDNGVLYFLENLGWIGTLLYFAGLMMPLVVIHRTPYARQDDFIVIARAIAVSLLIQMPTAIPVLHVTGMVVWGFTSYAMAGHLYYKALDGQPWMQSAPQSVQPPLNPSPSPPYI